MNGLEIVLTALLLGINVWGFANGLFTWGYVYRARNVNSAVTTLYLANIAMSLNVACWMFIIVLALVWPNQINSDQPLAVQIVGFLAFFGASVGITYALHRIMAVFMVPESQLGT